MPFNPDKFRKEVKQDFIKKTATIGTVDELFGLVTKEGVEFFLTMNLLGATYPYEDSATHGERVKIFREVTGIEIEWDIQEESLILPPHLQKMSEQVDEFNQRQIGN